MPGLPSSGEQHLWKIPSVCPPATKSPPQLSQSGVLEQFPLSRAALSLWLFLAAWATSVSNTCPRLWGSTLRLPWSQSLSASTGQTYSCSWHSRNCPFLFPSQRFIHSHSKCHPKQPLTHSWGTSRAASRIFSSVKSSRSHEMFNPKAAPTTGRPRWAQHGHFPRNLHWNAGRCSPSLSAEPSTALKP